MMGMSSEHWSDDQKAEMHDKYKAILHEIRTQADNSQEHTAMEEQCGWSRSEMAVLGVVLWKRQAEFVVDDGFDDGWLSR